MRIETITYEVYKYEELEERIKDKIRNDIGEDIVSNNFENLEWELNLILEEKYNIIGAKLHYSLTYSQGDGLSFDCSDLLESKYIKDKLYLRLNHYEKVMLTKMLKNNELKIFTKRSGNHLYEYALPTDVRIIDDFDRWTKNKEELSNKVQKILGELYMEICNTLEKIGYQCYEVSEQEIIDYIEVNELEFHPNGNIFLKD